MNAFVKRITGEEIFPLHGGKEKEEEKKKTKARRSLALAEAESSSSEASSCHGNACRGRCVNETLKRVGNAGKTTLSSVFRELRQGKNAAVAGKPTADEREVTRKVVAEKKATKPPIAASAPSIGAKICALVQAEEEAEREEERFYGWPSEGPHSSGNGGGFGKRGITDSGVRKSENAIVSAHHSAKKAFSRDDFLGFSKRQIDHTCPSGPLCKNLPASVERLDETHSPAPVPINEEPFEDYDCPAIIPLSQIYPEKVMHWLSGETTAATKEVPDPLNLGIFADKTPSLDILDLMLPRQQVTPSKIPAKSGTEITKRKRKNKKKKKKRRMFPSSPVVKSASASTSLCAWEKKQREKERDRARERDFADLLAHVNFGDEELDVRNPTPNYRNLSFSNSSNNKNPDHNGLNGICNDGHVAGDSNCKNSCNSDDGPPCNNSCNNNNCSIDVTNYNNIKKLMNEQEMIQLAKDAGITPGADCS